MNFLLTDDISENFIPCSSLDFLVKLILTSKEIGTITLEFINKRLCPKYNIIECHSFLEYSMFLSIKILTPISKYIVDEDRLIYLKFINDYADKVEDNKIIIDNRIVHNHVKFAHTLYLEGNVKLADELIKGQYGFLTNGYYLEMFPSHIREHIHDKIPAEPV